MSRSALGAVGLRVARLLPSALAPEGGGEVHMDFQKQSFESALDFLGSGGPRKMLFVLRGPWHWC